MNYPGYSEYSLLSPFLSLFLQFIPLEYILLWTLSSGFTFVLLSADYLHVSATMYSTEQHPHLNICFEFLSGIFLLCLCRMHRQEREKVDFLMMRSWDTL